MIHLRDVSRYVNEGMDALGRVPVERSHAVAIVLGECLETSEHGTRASGA